MDGIVTRDGADITAGIVIMAGGTIAIITTTVVITGDEVSAIR